MARMKQSAKKSAGGKAMRIDIPSTCRETSKIQQALQNSAHGKARRSTPTMSMLVADRGIKPTIRIPAMKQASGPVFCPSGSMVRILYYISTCLTNISFVFYARMEARCTSATTALVPCVLGAWRSRKRTSRL